MRIFKRFTNRYHVYTPYLKSGACSLRSEKKYRAAVEDAFCLHKDDRIFLELLTGVAGLKKAEPVRAAVEDAFCLHKDDRIFLELLTGVAGLKKAKPVRSEARKIQGGC
ncbi:hypothetical protein BALCAV_0210705 [Alkalihalobacillus alcalophilus ATCC 27647 = CGMCC 1.3604]|uniref:Uncharacterized protein n=1 Tax=Alkalihalobacillus alcalophilus ATCC 27647 = CGMCC 1.3604 TaxID=1218173 RepID=A0A094WKJ3_ALKAL|nr:hypothetical protein BALCAV_0210705 [Alkalihalobacillus alcalophilus ATCC 27647 = CGMCC 1.3604]